MPSPTSSYLVRIRPKGNPALAWPRWRAAVVLCFAALAQVAPGIARPEDDLVARSGIVRVHSPQPGAQVFIDNEEVGEAPVTRYLPEGSHIIRVVLDHFDPFVRRVEVRAGTTVDVDARLIPGRGTVEFQADPPSTRLILNSKDEWPTPVRLSELPPGTYTYELRAPGHESVKGKFTFREGQNLLIVQKLSSSAGLVDIQSTPDGAKVWLDGKEAGTTPLHLQDVPTGVHTVRLQRPDRAAVFRTFDTSDGSKGVVEARLPDEGGHLVVHTHDSSAKVSLAGTPIGSGRAVRFGPIERGRYDLQVTADGQAPASAIVDVPSHGRVDWAVHFDPANSKLVPVKPWYGRWTVWTAAGAGAVAVGVGSWLLVDALSPQPVPEGDVVVTLP